MTPAPDDLDAVCERVKAVLAKNPNASYFYTPSPSSIRANSAIIAADLRALLAQLEAAKRDSARLDAFDVWRIRADIVPYLTPTSRSVSFIDVKHGGVRLMGNGASIREALDNLASHSPTGAPENG